MLRDRKGCGAMVRIVQKPKEEELMNNAHFFAICQRCWGWGTNVSEPAGEIMCEKCRMTGLEAGPWAELFKGGRNLRAWGNG